MSSYRTQALASRTRQTIQRNNNVLSGALAQVTSGSSLSALAPPPMPTGTLVTDNPIITGSLTVEGPATLLGGAVISALSGTTSTDNPRMQVLEVNLPATFHQGVSFAGGTVQGLTPAMVGLGSVANIAEADREPNDKMKFYVNESRKGLVSLVDTQTITGGKTFTGAMTRVQTLEIDGQLTGAATDAFVNAHANLMHLGATAQPEVVLGPKEFRNELKIDGSSSSSLVVGLDARATFDGAVGGTGLEEWADAHPRLMHRSAVDEDVFGNKRFADGTTTSFAGAQVRGSLNVQTGARAIFAGEVGGTGLENWAMTHPDLLRKTKNERVTGSLTFAPTTTTTFESGASVVVNGPVVFADTVSGTGLDNYMTSFPGLVYATKKDQNVDGKKTFLDTTEFNGRVIVGTGGLTGTGVASLLTNHPTLLHTNKATDQSVTSKMIFSGSGANLAHFTHGLNVTDSNAVTTLNGTISGNALPTYLADDGSLVHNAKAETILGTKTFDAGAIIGTGAALWVHTTLTGTGVAALLADPRSNLAHIAGEETFTSRKTFGAGLAIPATTSLSVASGGAINVAGTLTGDGVVSLLDGYDNLVHVTDAERILGEKTFAGGVVVDASTFSLQNEGALLSVGANAVANVAGTLTGDGVVSLLDGYANLVHVTGAERIRGEKTFAGGVVVDASTFSLQNEGALLSVGSDAVLDVEGTLTGEGLVSLLDGYENLVHNAGEETIHGKKTFTGGLMVPAGAALDIRAQSGLTGPGLVALLDGYENLVHNTGEETINGKKTFAGGIDVTGGAVFDSITVNGEFLFAGDISSVDASAVHLKGDETITEGTKTLGASAELVAQGKVTLHGAVSGTGLDAYVASRPNLLHLSGVETEEVIAEGTKTLSSGAKLVLHGEVSGTGLDAYVASRPNLLHLSGVATEEAVTEGTKSFAKGTVLRMDTESSLVVDGEVSGSGLRDYIQQYRYVSRGVAETVTESWTFTQGFTVARDSETENAVCSFDANTALTGEGLVTSLDGYVAAHADVSLRSRAESVGGAKTFLGAAVFAPQEMEVVDPETEETTLVAPVPPICTLPPADNPDDAWLATVGQATHTMQRRDNIWAGTAKWTNASVEFANTGAAPTAVAAPSLGASLCNKTYVDAQDGQMLSAANAFTTETIGPLQNALTGISYDAGNALEEQPPATVLSTDLVITDTNRLLVGSTDLVSELGKRVRADAETTFSKKVTFSSVAPPSWNSDAAFAADEPIDPTEDAHLTTKKYVDAAAASAASAATTSSSLASKAVVLGDVFDVDGETVIPQSISGDKTFSGKVSFSSATSLPSVNASAPDPSLDTHLATKKYVDAAATAVENSMVSLVEGSTQTVYGDKTFQNAVTLNGTVGGTGLETYVNGAVDSGVNGMTTISGSKAFSGEVTFSSSSALPSLAGAALALVPSSDAQLVTKKYVDDEDKTAVHLAGTETITGDKTFSGDVALNGASVSGTGLDTYLGSALSAGSATLAAGIALPANAPLTTSRIFERITSVAMATNLTYNIGSAGDAMVYLTGTSTLANNSNVALTGALTVLNSGLTSMSLSFLWDQGTGTPNRNFFATVKLSTNGGSLGSAITPLFIGGTPTISTGRYLLQTFHLLRLDNTSNGTVTVFSNVVSIG